MDHLTEEQLAAATTKEKLSKVAAVAGSGKTTLLSSRVERLIRNGADPASIVAITFTRRSGRDLLEQLPAGCVVGTFHSVVLRLLDPMPYLMDEDETEQFFEHIARLNGDLVIGHYRTSKSKLQKQLRDARREESSHTSFSRMYVSKLQMDGKIDYDGILSKGLYMARLGPNGPMRFIKHLIVDEAQDNNAIQWDMVKAISRFAESVTVVGDSAQSLYSFRGAEPEQFDSIQWPTFNLSQSFRFCQNTAAYCNRMPVSRVPVRSNKAGTTLMLGRDEDLPRIVADYLAQGWDESEIAILCRYNRQVEDAQWALSQHRIQYAQKVRVLSNPVRDVMLYLASPESMAATQKAHFWPGLPIDPIRWIDTIQSIKTRADLVKMWVGNRTVADIFEQLKYDNIALHRDIVSQYGHLTPKQYAIETSQDDESEITGGVNVGTIHWSKGGEWPIVIIPYLNGRDWPRKGPISNEEWRVFYVAITRNQHQLCLLGETKENPFVQLAIYGNKT